MVTCPNCNAENRSGARFCKTCATRLPTSSAVTRPLELGSASTLILAAAARSTDPTQSSGSQATRRLNQNPRTGTHPLSAPPAFVRRPPGAIFGDKFLYDSLLFSDGNQHRYLVQPVNTADELQIGVCPNPVCGAIFLPRNATPEKFCTDCGTVLEPGAKDLVLIEARAPIADSLVRTAAKGLSHGTVRAPLAAFVERLGDMPRHCLVAPYTAPLETTPDSLQGLRWGIALARGLDYLHENGVTFDGRIDAGKLGLVGERAVWADFSACSHDPTGYVADRKTDSLALARLIFSWLTGKSSYQPDANLSPEVSQAFEHIFAPPGIGSGLELADRLEEALSEIATMRAVDFYMGRRTHVGMVRSLNEDSIMSVEINRIHQSISRPLGVYVVADGMGGHAAGEIASGTIINSISQKALTDLMPVQNSLAAAQDRSAWLRQAVENANSEVFKLRKSTGNDMGSTLVSAVLEGNQAYVTHIGDSRAYLINPQSIRRLTVDHSLVERLIQTHQITREEARHHPQRNVIYRTVGDKGAIEVEVSAFTLNVGDSLLLCSDGLSGMLEDTTIQQIVLSAASPQDACDELVRAANDAGGEDNISVIIVKIVEA